MRVEGIGTSFAADYYPGLHFTSICVNYDSSSKFRVIKWNIASYYFTNCHGRIFHPRQST